MTSVLLIDDDDAHAERVGATLAQRRLTVTRVAEIGEGIKRLQSQAHAWDIVVLVIGDRSRPWFTILHSLQEVAWHGALPEVPFFLCASERDLGLDFELRIERMGARYACEE